MTNPSKRMTSCRPYLLKAIYEWIVSNNLTPHIRVNAMMPGVNVPQRYVVNGEIVLDISPMAVNNWLIELRFLAFEARFEGIVEQVHVPMSAIMAIYARENGRGMIFEPEPEDEFLPADEGKEQTVFLTEKPKKTGRSRGHLRVVKSDVPSDTKDADK